MQQKIKLDGKDFLLFLLLPKISPPSIFLFNGDLESPSLWGVDPILFLLLMIYKVLRGQGIFLIHFDL